jgi:acetyl-CoA carboxylase carboxyltransferase component
VADRADRGDGRRGRGQQILYRKELAAAEGPGSPPRSSSQEYNDELANPYVAAERGYIDQVIYPHETRAQVIRVAAAAAHQARVTAAQEAREHPAVSGAWRSTARR